ncbi:IS200/IS605 family transposase [Luteolibacter sp. Populi]|uniref:IS200/IS605 family transposase n=1 Tax=Luteolibacter sp. Populi TaxID=3230487 RepID=UPI0034662A30
MPSTHTSLHYHVIFATKHRERLIDPAWQEDLHEYLGGTIRGLGGVSEGIGGVADHVHVLVSLKATHCLADFMRELKRASSVWVAEQKKSRDFKWQEGYAAFSVSASARERVQEYIAGQEKHHGKKTFREELVDFLKGSGVGFDEKYLD